MPYYAHIRQDENGETIYQTVAEHLTGTAALCREFAADFGAEADGDLMGLAHDLGKCTDAFQKRLLEGGPVVDHTTAGMLTCIRIIAFFPLCLLDYRVPRGRCGPAPPRASPVTTVDFWMSEI